jgi:uncharacterized protein
VYGGHSELIAWVGETFASVHNALRAANAFKAGASTARYDVYLDASNAYRWRAWRSSDKVAASGQSFSSKSAAQVAADNVGRNAGASGLAAPSAQAVSQT